MATKKDLVEAHSFSRRRLVTAFVSGAPGGREVEPARPGRTIVGGIALAILLVAGAAVLGVFKSRVEIDWESPGIVTDKDTGALYVILPDSDTTGLDGSQPNVRGITNVTSARLILGSETEVQQAPTEEIANEKKGATIGIPDAPAAPATDDLVQSGWSACTAAGRGVQLRLRATDDPAEVTATPGTNFLVKSEGKTYVVAEADGRDGDPRRAYTYLVPKGSPKLLTNSIGSDVMANAVDVPSQWLALFPEGGPLSLAGFGIDPDEEGDPAPDGSGSGVPDGAKVGDRFAVDDGIGLFTPDGPVVVSEAFAVRLLDQLPGGKTFKGPDVADIEPIGDAAYLESEWPTDSLGSGQFAPSGDALCGVIEPSSDEEPAVLLAGDPQGEAEPSDDSAPDDSDVSVSPGHGAVVLSAGMDSTSGGQPVLLDERGLSHVLAGSATSDLGYGDVDLPRVPDTWVELFTKGVALSRDAALCPPTSRQGCS